MTEGNGKISAFLTISLAWLFYLCSFLARAEPSVLANDLMMEFHVNSYVIGGCVSIMYLAYVPLQIPCGLIVDKIGVRKMICLSGLLCALGTFVFGLADSVGQLECGRFLIGAASAPAFLCCGKIAADFFSKERFSLLMGLSMALGCCGGVFGTAPFAVLADKIGWRKATMFVALCCAVVGLLAFFFIKENKKESKKNVEGEKKGNLLQGLKILVSNKKIWLLGFYGMVSYLPLSALAELWIVPFARLRFGLETDIAGFSASVIFIGFGVGGVVSAWFAKKINSYKKTIILFTIGMVFAFSFVIYNDSIGYNLSLFLMFFGGVFAGANTLCFGLAYSFVPEEYAGTSSGVVNALIMTSGVFQKFLGWVLDFLRNGNVADGVPVYELVTYRGTFYFVIIFMIIAVFVNFFIPDLKASKFAKVFEPSKTKE